MRWRSAWSIGTFTLMMGRRSFWSGHLSNRASKIWTSCPSWLLHLKKASRLLMRRPRFSADLPWIRGAFCTMLSLKSKYRRLCESQWLKTKDMGVTYLVKLKHSQMPSFIIGKFTQHRKSLAREYASIISSQRSWVWLRTCQASSRSFLWI